MMAPHPPTAPHHPSAALAGSALSSLASSVSYSLSNIAAGLSSMGMDNSLLPMAASTGHHYDVSSILKSFFGFGVFR
jgi:hypothetical protein